MLPRERLLPHHPVVTEQAARATAQVARLFAELAPVYDSSGVEFFGPMARRLVELLAPRPGERALDIGCGRGAASLPLAEAVGPRARSPRPTWCRPWWRPSPTTPCGWACAT